jgi:TonB family protein
MKMLCLFLVIITLGHADNYLSPARPLPQPTNQPSEKVYEPKEVDQKAKVIKRSEPQYTEQARRNHTSGFVVLRAVLKSSGEVGEIKVIRDLPDGLTEECIRVTREIKFEPAVKDGNSVSQYLRVQYEFYVG